MKYLDAVKLLAHKAGLDEAVYKEVVLAFTIEHGDADEIKAAKEWATPDSSKADAAFQASVDAEIARRKADAPKAAAKAKAKKAKAKKAKAA